MAELRGAEHELSEIVALYTYLRTHESVAGSLPELSRNEEGAEEADAGESETSSQSCVLSNAELVTQINDVKTRIIAMDEKVTKFKKRSLEKDPVTENPRYGQKTLERIQELSQRHQELRQIVELSMDGDKLSVVQSKAKQEEEKARRDDLEARKRAEQEAEEARNQERLRLENERLLLEEKRAKEEAERAEAYRLAQENIEAARLVRQQAEQADQEWMDSIPKGVEGVRGCLERLLEATKDDSVAQQVAIDALYTLFSQIVARPEETNFRRIRRDHPKFNADIGQHEGGKELLIASGFKLGAIDDVPSFVSTEPSLEKDMDGWASWFDLKKATLAVIEEQMLK